SPTPYDTRHALVSSLRSHGPSVALNIIRFPARRSSSRWSWCLQDQSSYSRIARTLDINRDRYPGFWYACEDGLWQSVLWRCLRSVSDWLDHPQRNIPLSTHEGARAIRCFAPQHHWNHARLASSTPAGCLLLRRFLLRSLG